ncbi:hypothetical protein ACWEQ8_44370, partial [Streptomyces noursei]
HRDLVALLVEGASKGEFRAVDAERFATRTRATPSWAPSCCRAPHWWNSPSAPATRPAAATWRSSPSPPP